MRGVRNAIVHSSKDLSNMKSETAELLAVPKVPEITNEEENGVDARFKTRKGRAIEEEWDGVHQLAFLPWIS
jgi:hypothetical protein